MQNLRSVLDAAALDVPPELLQYYDCGDIDSALQGILLSRKGIISPYETSVARLWICSECNAHLQRRSLPKFPIRNGFLSGNYLLFRVGLPSSNV
jgi:hypothetical protein